MSDEALTVEQVKALIPQAEGGDVDAQLDLGYFFSVHGLNGTPDYEASLKWTSMAVAQNHPLAHFNLAMMYDAGQGVEIDSRKVFEHILKASELGYDSAYLIVARLYDNEDGVEKNGVEKNPTEAFKWYQKAAELNNRDAWTDLAHAYQHGEGVEKDLVKALEWYQKAANEECPYAIYSLAEMYAAGEGCHQDFIKAADMIDQCDPIPDDLEKWNLKFLTDIYQGILSLPLAPTPASLSDIFRQEGHINREYKRTRALNQMLSAIERYTAPSLPILTSSGDEPSSYDCV